MAVPNIQPFDPSPYQRTRIAGVQKAFDVVGEVAGLATKAAVSKHIESKNLNTAVNDIMAAEEEHYDHISNLYGQPIQEKETLLPKKAFDRMLAEAPEGKILNPEFVRAVNTRKVTPESGQRFKHTMNVKRTQLQEIVNSKALTAQEKLKALDLYKESRANYAINVATFQREWGMDAIPWVEPTVKQYIADPTGKNIFTAQKEKFVKEGKEKYLNQKIKTYLERQDVKDAIAAHRQQIAAGPEGKQTPVLSGLGTTDHFYQWLIENKGVPDTEVQTEGPNKGQKFPDNIQEGRFHGKIISELGKTENYRLVDRLMQDMKTRTAEVQKLQETKATQTKTAQKESDKRKKYAEGILRHTGLQVQNQVDKKTKATQDALLKEQRFLKGEIRDMTDPDKIKAIKREHRLAVNTAKLAETDAIRTQEVEQAYNALVSAGKFPPQPKSLTDFKNMMKEVFDDEKETQDAVIIAIEKVLKPELYERETEGAAAGTEDIESRISPDVGETPAPAVPGQRRPISEAEE